MPNQPNGKSGGKVEWVGEERLNHSPTVIVEKLRVNGENGRSCHGSLSLYDESFKKNRQFTWEAQYIGDGHWNVVSPIAGEAASDCLNRTEIVNHDMTILIQDKLNVMRKDGVIFRPQPNPSASGQPKPPAPTAPAPARPAAAKDPPPPPPPPAPPPPKPSVPGATAPAVVSQTNNPPPPAPSDRQPSGENGQDTTTDNPKPPPVAEAKPGDGKTTNPKGDDTMKEKNNDGTIAKVVEAVCATFGVTQAEMRDNKKRSHQFVRAREVITYLLRELGQKAPATLKAIGAKPRSNGLFYTHSQKVATLLGVDHNFADIVNKLRREVGLTDAVINDRLTKPRAGKKPASKNGGLEKNNPLADRVLTVICQVAFMPLLFGEEKSGFDLETLRALTVYLLFRQNFSVEQIAALAHSETNRIQLQIGLATIALKDNEAVAALVKKAEAELRV